MQGTRFFWLQVGNGPARNPLCSFGKDRAVLPHASHIVPEKILHKAPHSRQAVAVKPVRTDWFW